MVSALSDCTSFPTVPTVRFKGTEMPSPYPIFGARHLRESLSGHWLATEENRNFSDHTQQEVYMSQKMVWKRNKRRAAALKKQNSAIPEGLENHISTISTS